MKKIIIILLLSNFIFEKAYSQTKGGLNLISAEEYAKIPVAPTPSGGRLPPRVDLSPGFPRPSHQGTQMSCVGWACAYALKSYQEAIEHKWSVNASSNHFSPSFIYNQIQLGIDRGSTFPAAFKVMQEQGVARWNDFPYDPQSTSRRPNARQLEQASGFKISSWETINPKNIVSIKSHLAAKIPVLFSTPFGENFISLPSNTPYNGVENHYEGNHAMIVVGYDDSKQSFLIMNSWGTSWSNNGFGWYSYSAFSRMVNECYIVHDSIQPLTKNNQGNLRLTNDGRQAMQTLSSPSFTASFDVFPYGYGNIREDWVTNQQGVRVRKRFITQLIKYRVNRLPADKTAGVIVYLTDGNGRLFSPGNDRFGAYQFVADPTIPKNDWKMCYGADMSSHEDFEGFENGKYYTIEYQIPLDAVREFHLQTFGQLKLSEIYFAPAIVITTGENLESFVPLKHFKLFDLN